MASWQLRRAGMTWMAIEHHTRDLRQLYDGVHLTGDAPVTRRQRWWAASLTAPGRVLGHASAGAAWEFRPWEGCFEVVTALGSGGPRRHAALLVCRSNAIDATDLDGLPITTPERTLADLWPHLGDRAQRRMLREALRLHPEINQRRAGEEADLSWPARRLIIEIDGDQFHRHKLEDARKTAAWTAAGWRVRRVQSDVVFREPERFVEVTRNELARSGVQLA